MKKSAAILMFALLAGHVTAPLLAEGTGEHERVGAGHGGVVPGQVLVRFGDDVDDARVSSLLRSGGDSEQARSQYVRGLRVVTLPRGESVTQGVVRLRALPGVVYAEPNYMRRLHFQPNDPRFSLQWNMKMLGVNRTWDIQKGSTSVTVAVIDSGVAYEDLGPMVVNFEVLYGDGRPRTVAVGPFRRTPDWGSTQFATGVDAIFHSGHAWDDEGHGTHVASTIAEATDNNLGVTGLAFGVTLMPIKACVSQPWYDPELVGCPTFAIAEGIDYARTNGAKVINLSLGSEDAATSEREAIQRAAAANIVVVASAGNENGPVDYPAAYESVIAVGAVNSAREKASYSNFGAELDLVAPGGDGVDRDGDGTRDFVFQQTIDPDQAERGIYNLRVDLLWGFSGTSMASPHVAAAAALLISQGITDATAVRKALEQTADDLGAPGRDDRFGWGLINPAKALSGLGLNK
jgi:serine protease